MGNWFGIFSDSTPTNTETNTQLTGSGGAMDDVAVLIPDGEESCSFCGSPTSYRCPTCRNSPDFAYHCNPETTECGTGRDVAADHAAAFHNNHPEMDTFNTVSMIVKLTFADEEGKVLESVEPEEPRIWMSDDDTFRSVTAEELASVTFNAPQIAITSEWAKDDEYVLYKAPNGEHFSMTDMIDVLTKSEQYFRPQSAWFGRVDDHHIFFEGFDRTVSGAYAASWGS